MQRSDPARLSIDITPRRKHIRDRSLLDKESAHTVRAEAVRAREQSRLTSRNISIELLKAHSTLQSRALAHQVARERNAVGPAATENNISDTRAGPG